MRIGDTVGIKGPAEGVLGREIGLGQHNRVVGRDIDRMEDHRPFEHIFAIDANDQAFRPDLARRDGCVAKRGSSVTSSITSGCRVTRTQPAIPVLDGKRWPSSFSAP